MNWSRARTHTTERDSIQSEAIWSRARPRLSAYSRESMDCGDPVHYLENAKWHLACWYELIYDVIICRHFYRSLSAKPNENKRNKENDANIENAKRKSEQTQKNTHAETKRETELHTHDQTTV